MGNCYGHNTLFAPVLCFTNLVIPRNKDRRKEHVVEPEPFWRKNLTSSCKIAMRPARTEPRPSTHAARWLRWAGRTAGGETWTKAGFGRARLPEPEGMEEAGTGTWVPTRSHPVVGPESPLLLLCIHNMSWARGNLRREGRVFTHPISLCVRDEQGSRSWRIRASMFIAYPNRHFRNEKLGLTLMKMPKDFVIPLQTGRQAAPFPLFRFDTSSLLTTV